MERDAQWPIEMPDVETRPNLNTRPTALKEAWIEWRESNPQPRDIIYLQPI